MSFYLWLATAILFLHLLFILWVIFGSLLTRRRPLLRWLHIGSLVYGILLELFGWTCPLTPLENWLRARGGASTYSGGFLLHYLDSAVYPDVPLLLLTVCAVAVCLFNLGIYAFRFFAERRSAGR